MIEALPVVMLLVAAAAAYGVGLRRIRRRLPRRVLPTGRAVSFYLGLLVLAGALIGPLDGAADDRFSLHMVQHALLVLVAAPLLALGTPITMLVLALSPAARRRTTTPALRSRAAHVLFAPPLAWAAFVVVLCGSHLPAIYDAAVANQGLHDLEHLAYLVTAVLFWMPVVGLDIGPKRLPHPARLLYLFLAMAAMAVVGVALSTGDRAIYGYYAQAARVHHYSAVADQHTGGVIMWISGMFTLVPALAAVVLSWMAEDERRTVQMEQRQGLPSALPAVPR